jgi:signal transduction histidine kinase
MSNSLLTQLRDVANKALKCENPEEGMKYLAEAFSLFSQQTHELKESYERLQTRFDEVNLELENTNVQLKKKVKELNTIGLYLNNILKNISQGIIFIDTEGVITTYNEEAKEILEKEKEEILFKSYWNNFSDDYFGFSMKSALKIGLEKSTLLKLSFLEKEKEVEISSTFVYEESQPYQGLIILLKDVTEMRSLQKIANRNERLKELGEMAATVSHEIRNPLGGIRGYASLLYRDLANTKHLQEMAFFIVEGTKTLERLVNNVLHFSKPVELKKEPINLCSLLKDLYKFVKVDPTFPKEVLLECHIPEDEIWVKVDKELFRSSILNLIVNGYQAIEKSGKVTLALLKNNNSCILSVSDTGVGIKSSDLEKIFTPFFTTKERGNGLGLAETYKIIQAHAGTIDVRSLVNIGTTFTINLPLKS